MASVQGTFGWEVDREEAKQLLPLYGHLLTFKERRTVTMFYGLEGQVAVPQPYIAKRYNITRGSVGSCLKLAMNKMRECKRAE